MRETLKQKCVFCTILLHNSSSCNDDDDDDDNYVVTDKKEEKEEGSISKRKTMCKNVGKGEQEERYPR